VRDRQAIDVLLVSPGTTAGWRRTDGELVKALEELGVSVATCSSDYRAVRHLRRTVLMTDLAEALAMRRALSRALKRYQPRAILYSSPQAAMLQPRSRIEGATAVRFDAPAAVNRRGAGAGLLHALERRALGQVRLLLPIGIAPDASIGIAADVPAIALPIPIDLEANATDETDPIVLAYAGNPEKKGLDIAARAWALAAPQGWRLIVTGIDPESGRRFLARRGIANTSDIEWAGTVEPAQYEALLRSARVFLSASRFEDYGIAQLEALAAGAQLVTVPSGGPYEALAFARELDSTLVASSLSAESLADALKAAFAQSDEARASYSRRARELLRPYSRETVRQRLSEQVLPLLLE
jgi:glycosyltransferase involved in cell wall biosynthesis